MKLAALFPGQGSQAVGMGQDLAQRWSVAADVFGTADQALGDSLSDLCWTGPEEALRLDANGQVPVTYVDAQGNPADYPGNPNGSNGGVAGVCNLRGNVFGLMPHPEDHVHPYQHPRWTRGGSVGSGLPLFEAGVRYAGGL